MNQTSAPSWSHIAHHDPMVSAPEDDFASFLEFGELHLNYADYALNAQDGNGNPHGSGGAVDTRMENIGASAGLREGHLLLQHDEVGNNGIGQNSGLTSMGNITGSEEPLMDFNIRADIFHQQQQQQHQQHVQTQTFHHPSVIPPTPNSMKMHGGADRYYQQVDPQAQALYERYARMKEDQVRLLFYL